jgi:hypothetical protein
MKIDVIRTSGERETLAGDMSHLRRAIGAEESGCDTVITDISTPFVPAWQTHPSTSEP